MTIKNIRHTGIVVSDMERSLSFYRDMLGLTPLIDFTESGAFIDTILKSKGVRIRMVKLTAEDGGMIELLHYNSRQQSERMQSTLWTTGLTHIALTVDDVDSLYELCRKNGVPSNSEPSEAPDGKAKLFFCQDPDGTFLELVEELK